MKAYIVRTKPDGFIFSRNPWRWWSGGVSSVFEDPNADPQKHDWHIFGQGEVDRTTSATPWGRFTRCITPVFWQIKKNFFAYGALNPPTSQPDSYNWIEDIPIVQTFVNTLQKEWPELLDKNLSQASVNFNPDVNAYVECVIAENLEVVEIDLETGQKVVKPFLEYATKRIQSRHKKLMKDRIAGNCVHK